MIFEEARYVVDVDHVDAFLHDFAAALPLIRAADGCHDAHLHRSVEHPTHFVLWVRWESIADHLNGFREGPDFEQWRQLTRPYLTEPVFMHHVARCEI
jgi:quinol monooxygenase YgiN